MATVTEIERVQWTWIRNTSGGIGRQGAVERYITTFQLLDMYGVARTPRN